MFVAVVRDCSFNFSRRIPIFKLKYKVTDHESGSVNFPHFTADLYAK